MKIPEPIRDKFKETVVVENPVIKENGNGALKNITKGIESEKNGEDKRKGPKKRKIRMCLKSGICSFKNVWTYADRCYAPFSVWNTCMNKGDERKV